MYKMTLRQRMGPREIPRGTTPAISKCYPSVQMPSLREHLPDEDFFLKFHQDAVISLSVHLDGRLTQMTCSKSTGGGLATSGVDLLVR